MDRDIQTSLMVLAICVCGSSFIWIPCLLSVWLSIVAKRHEEFLAELEEADRILNQDYADALNTLAKSNEQNTVKMLATIQRIKDEKTATSIIEEFWSKYGKK